MAGKEKGGGKDKDPGKHRGGLPKPEKEGNYPGRPVPKDDKNKGKGGGKKGK